MKSRIIALVLGLFITATVYAGLETATYINELVTTNPVGATDPKSQGDDHLRLIKSTLKNTFPNVSGAVNLTHTQINNAAIKDERNDYTKVQRIVSEVSGVATSGSGLELRHASGTSYLTSYNRTSSTGLPLVFEASTVNVGGGIATAVTVNGGFNLTTLASATYTPSASAGANCSGVTGLKHFYQRVGNIVTLSGRVSLTVTSGGGVLTNLAIALPVASNFTNGFDVAGSGHTTTITAAGAYARADTINDTIIVEFFSTASGAQDLIYNAQYIVQ